MKDKLAEDLLFTVLGLDQLSDLDERIRLQTLARFKYDEYQQFAPGRRFVESLARWLSRFDTEDRQAAYEFAMQQVIFFSSAEINHLVGMAYADCVRPHLLTRVAEECGHNRRHVRRIVESAEFKARQRQCLFLGLSDGAQMDVFRRANRELSHEQISRTHELAPDRIKKFQKKLKESLTVITGDVPNSEPRFRTVVLLDDFSASGHTYYMPEDDGSVSGKIKAFHDAIMDSKNPLFDLVDTDQLEVFIVLYVGTEDAKSHLDAYSRRIWTESGTSVDVEVVQPLSPLLRLTDETIGGMRPLVKKYYDDDIFDEHMRKGKSADGRYGFAGCGLPVVMHHNTPNNSIALLWSYEDTEFPGLFPRVRRHQSTRPEAENDGRK